LQHKQVSFPPQLPGDLFHQLIFDTLIEEDTTLKGDKVGKTLRIDRRSET
jgi:hypothetical protein